MSDLSEELAKSPHLSWRAGMYGHSPTKNIYQRYAGCGIWVDGDDGFIRYARFVDLQPVLSDAPTQGALLEIVQFVYKAPEAYVKWHAVWECYFVGGLPVGVPTPQGTTRGEALANAILQVKP